MTSMIAPHSHRLTARDRIAVIAIGIARLSDGFGNVQGDRHRHASPLIGERRVAARNGRHEAEHERKVIVAQR